MGGFDEGAHPRADDGKFASGGGGGSPGTGHERVKASLGDRAFVQKHADRLSRAAEAARSKFPRSEHGGDEAHHAALKAIHEEAARIHAEDDAVAGEHEARLREAAEDGAFGHRFDHGADDLQGAHEARMQSVEREKGRIEEEKADRANEDEAIKAGHVGTEARDIMAEYEAAHADAAAANVKHVDAVDQAQRRVLDALDSLHEYEHTGNDEIDGNELESTHSLAGMIDDTRRQMSEMSEAVGEHSRDVRAPRELPEHVPHPNERDDDEDELSTEEHDAALAAHGEYRKQVDAHEAEFAARAATAKQALEDLHAKQREAIADLKRTYQAAKKSGSEAIDKLDALEESSDDRLAKTFSGHEVDEDGEYTDSAVSEAHSRAARAAETMREHARATIESRDVQDPGDLIDLLREEMGGTKRAIKELSAVVKRSKPSRKRPV